MRDGVACDAGLPNRLCSYALNVAVRQLQKHGRARGSSCNKFGARSFGDRRTTRQNFNASRLAASANGPAVVNADVAALARRPGASMIDAPDEDDSGADTGSDSHINNIVVPAPGAPPDFRQRRRICIVVHLYRKIAPASDFCGKRKIPPAGNIRRINNDSRLWIERAGCTNSNRTDISRTL